MRNLLIFWLAGLLPTVLVAQTSSSPPPQPIAFTHVTVIDMTGAPPKPGMTVVVDGERIVGLGRTGKVRVPAAARIVDSAGKFLIPGLWDMHVHTLVGKRPSYFFSLFVANGVTGVRDMGGTLTLDEIDRLRREIAAGTIVAPRLVAPGRFINGTGGRLDIGVAADTPEQAREFVRSFKQQGADFVKVYELLSRDVYLSIAAEAKRQGFPFAGHVPFAVSAADASDLGQKSNEHTTGIFISTSRDEEALRRELVDASKLGRTSLSVRQHIELKAIESNDARKEAALFQRFARNGTWQCPTLTVRRSSILTDEQQLLADVRLKYIPQHERQRWRNIFKERLASAAELERFKQRYRRTLEIVGAMYRANVGILAGTDILNPYLYPGFSLHEELELLVEAGLTPFAALQAATVNPAKFFGREKEFGTIGKGKRADLVLLDANPLERIGNTQNIAAVVVNGRYLPKEELQRLLADVEAMAKNE